MNDKQVFLAYKFGGVDLNLLKETIPKVVKWLDEQTESFVFCSLFFEPFFRIKKWSDDQILYFCTLELKKCETFVCFINNEEPSEGMNKELKESLKCNHSRILLIRRGLDFPEFRKACHIVVEFDDVDSLIKYSHVI